jgi:phenylpyruvate tautomerase PptA (4-oxalocrotonate tautomerase family)
VSRPASEVHRMSTDPTTVHVSVDPGQTLQEEQELVARVAAAIAESTGVQPEDVVVELHASERLQVPGTSVAERMQGSARWSA